MRIAFDGRSLASPAPRGWDRYAMGLVQELVRLGIDVTLIHRAGRPLHAPHVAALGCRVESLPALSGIHYEQVAVPWAIRRGKYDLFHAPFEHGVPLLTGRPVVLTIHSLTVHSYEELVASGKLPGKASDYLGSMGKNSTLSGMYWRMQAARANHILTPSEFSRQEIIRFLNVRPARVTSTPLAVHAQFLRAPRSPDDRRTALEKLGVRTPFLLYVGGYEAHKNVRGVLEAFSLVRAARPDLSLVVVGTTAVPDETVREAEKLGLRSGIDVKFLVNLCDELNDLYDETELLVTLSWRETFCLPALEAMTRGRPVVASAWGATPEVVGEAGRVVDPRDPAAARDAILELLKSDGPALAVLARGQAARFSWERTAAQTLEVYKSLLGKVGQEGPS